MSWLSCEGARARTCPRNGSAHRRCSACSPKPVYLLKLVNGMTKRSKQAHSHWTSTVRRGKKESTVVGQCDHKASSAHRTRVLSALSLIRTRWTVNVARPGGDPSRSIKGALCSLSRHHSSSQVQRGLGLCGHLFCFALFAAVPRVDGTPFELRTGGQRGSSSQKGPLDWTA